MRKSSANSTPGAGSKTAPESPTPDADALERYRKKRDPAKTNEPFSAERITSESSGTNGAFVVHLHDARRRHWDVRLEINGVLESFAVPKGPSLDPSERRLAVHTEQHPLEYLDFEDVIPEGNYGAGAMIVWDTGRVRYLEPAPEGLQKGKLDLVFSGHKLRGRYAFVRTGDRASKKPNEKDNWLFFKKADAFSSTERDILVEEPASVLSGLTVEDLLRKADVAVSLEERAIALGAPVGDVDARRLTPMLCGTAPVGLEEPDRFYELKLDGVRLLADKRGGDVALVYRSGRVMSATYPEVVRAVRALATDRVVLDGEVVAFDDAGRPSFHRLGRRMHLTRPHDVRFAASEVPVVYVVFDVLAIGDRDLRSLPLRARKELLASLAPRSGFIRLLDHLEGDGRPLDEICRSVGLEGMIAKRAASTYQPGPERSNDWVKLKREREEDFLIVGWVEGNGDRKSLGAVELATYVGDKVVFRGRAGSGLDERTIADLLARLGPLEVDEPTAVGEPFRDSGVRHFTRPELVASVRFTSWTEDGHVRHPVFRGLRPDVAPASCTAAPAGARDEEPIDAAPVEAPRPREKPSAPLKTRAVVTNRDKVFWPDEGYTKGDLIDYYAAISDVLLPFIHERPLVLVRYPDGILGKNFFQWNVPVGTPSWIRTLRHPDSDGTGPGKNTFVVDDVDGLIHIANLGCIPVHVLPYRSSSMEESDYFVVDFDIGARPFSDAVVLAFTLRELLDEIGLVGFPKTSGQSGLHVLVPLGPGVAFDTSKTLVELVCRLVQSKHPDISTMERRIAGRGDRVFIDAGQTGRSRTIVAPYSVRAATGATVSMPLLWDEVHRALDPRKFTMFTVRERVDERGDPLDGFFDVRPNVAEVVGRLGKKLGA